MVPTVLKTLAHVCDHGFQRSDSCVEMVMRRRRKRRVETGHVDGEYGVIEVVGAHAGRSSSLGMGCTKRVKRTETSSRETVQRRYSE